MDDDELTFRETTKYYYRILWEAAKDVAPPVITVVVAVGIVVLLGWAAYKVIMATGYPVTATVVFFLVLVFVIGPIIFHYVVKALR